MDTNNPTDEQTQPTENATPMTGGKEEPVLQPANTEKRVLPLALRDIEITESDVLLLLRIAQDKTAPTGRYKRAPKKMPTTKSTNTRK